MKLFFDEDTGGSVPRALRAIGIRDSDWVGKDRCIKPGTYNEDWLPYVGQNGYLLISCNRAILRAEAQRSILIRERLGAVFLASGKETRFSVLRLLLNRWQWLEAIDANEPRPFAYLLYASGMKQRYRL